MPPDTQTCSLASMSVVAVQRVVPLPSTVEPCLQQLTTAVLCGFTIKSGKVTNTTRKAPPSLWAKGGRRPKSSTARPRRGLGRGANWQLPYYFLELLQPPVAQAESSLCTNLPLSGGRGWRATKGKSEFHKDFKFESTHGCMIKKQIDTPLAKGYFNHGG